MGGVKASSNSIEVQEQLPRNSQEPHNAALFIGIGRDAQFQIAGLESEISKVFRKLGGTGGQAGKVESVKRQLQAQGPEWVAMHR